MAEFNEVHRDQLESDRRPIRPGECWTIALREILAPPEPIASDAAIKTVRFIASADGTLKPATELDLSEIMDWERRHKNTPPSWFELPRGLLREETPHQIEATMREGGERS